jgi:hypothetical protein
MANAFDDCASAVILWARSAPRSRPLGGHQALQAKVLTNDELAELSSTLHGCQSCWGREIDNR